MLQPTEVGPFHKTVLYPDNNWRRFEAAIQASRGVIDGTGARFGHTVAYDHGRIYDPAGRSTTTPGSPARPTSSTPAAPGGSTPMENASVSNQYNRELVAEMAWLCKPFCSEDNGRLYPLVAAGDSAARGSR